MLVLLRSQSKTISELPRGIVNRAYEIQVKLDTHVSILGSLAMALRRVAGKLGETCSLLKDISHAVSSTKIP